jgi:hypothetical protein
MRKIKFYKNVDGKHDEKNPFKNTRGDWMIL